jgi:hypothetical protein
MRKQLYVTIFAGVFIGIILALIVMAVSKTASPPESALLQPVKINQATMSDRDIRSAQGIIEKSPADPKGYNMLAAAFMQKARETGDFSLNARAEESLKHSFRVAPDNYDGIKLQAALLLNYHRFSEALQTAQRACAPRLASCFRATLVRTAQPVVTKHPITYSATVSIRTKGLSARRSRT